MKITVRDEIWQHIEGGVPYDIRVNPDLKQLFVALADVIGGKKVMVIFNGDIPRDDDWHFVPLLPMTFMQIPSVLRKLRRLKYWEDLASHLVRPVKTIWSGTSYTPWKLRMVDRFRGNQLHNASQWIDLSDIPVQEFAFANISSAFGYQEWKMNIGRLIMELCKEIHFRGGIVLNYAEVEASGEGTILNDLVTGAHKLILARSIVQGKMTSRPEVEMGLTPWSGFVMRIPYHDDYLELIDREGKLMACMVFSKDHGLLAEAVRKFLGTGVQDLKWGSRQSHDLDDFSELPSDKLEGYRLMAAPGVDNSPVEDAMETAFDISKQTGISFKEFRDLYYRYGAAMDHLTEEAYQIMNQSREYSFIWERVIQEYSERFEWKIRNEG
jgi:hypothetical protein